MSPSETAQPLVPSAGERVLVTGATGYIGGRLVPRLLESGYRVRCLARSPRKLEARPWSGEPGVEIVQGDADDRERLREVLTGCHAAYYLIHSMVVAGSEYAEYDIRLAKNFAAAAHEAGVERILYLGGLGETGEHLSEHLSSRRDVEQALASTAVPVTVLRAAMIVGSGSASFEILRYLVERLPVMITPRWVSTECQPIGIVDVLGYLVGCLVNPATTGLTLDIGGPDVRSYRELMQIMARALGLPRRWIVPVPVLTPRLSSRWIQIITPLSYSIARPLAEGLRNRVVCRNNDILELVPQRLLPVQAAIEQAVDRVQDGTVETTWHDAGPMPGDPNWAGGTSFTDERSTEVAADPATVFRAVCRIGGGNGWYAADYLWRLRGFLDQLLGGPGLRRGRRDPEKISYGEALDFWRVTGLEADRSLSLRAEMKLPGEALLEFNIEPQADGTASRLTQTASFLPRGLFGLLYWYAVVPLHSIVFRGMLKGIRRTAEEMTAADRTASDAE